MSNYLKHLDVKVYPTTSGGWDSHTSNDPTFTWSGDGTDTNPITSIPIGTKTSLNDILWPETEYTANFTGVDAYDNALSISNETFTTALDYPIFCDVSACSRMSGSGYDGPGYDFKVKDVNEYVKDNAQNGEIVYSEDAKAALNTEFLSANSFSAYNVIDFRDKNAFQPESFKSTQFKPVISASDPIYTNYYRDNGNNLIPRKQNLIQFSTLNRRLGIDTIQATMVWDGETRNTGPVSFPGTGSSSLGGDVVVNDGYQDNFVPESFDIDTTKTIQNYDTNADNVFEVYYAHSTVNTSRPAAWIGIYTKKWETNDHDASGTITITAKSKTKNQSGAQSTLTIPFNTYAAPAIDIFMNDGGVESTPTLVNNAYYNALSMTSLHFNGGSSGAGYIFKTQTKDIRPYVPLVNYNRTLSNDIIDSTIKNFSPYSAYLFGNEYQNISIPQREIPVIVEVAAGAHTVQSWSRPFAFDTLAEAQSFTDNDSSPIGTTSIAKEWKTIGAAPISDDGSINIVPEYHDEDTQYGLHKEQIINPTATMTVDNQHHSIFKWPEGDCVLKDIASDDNTLDLLVPGKYYKFRVTTANLCGTRSKTFIFKMQDPDERFYSSRIESSSLSNPVSIGPTSADTPNQVTLNLPTNSTINVYGNECDSTTVRNNIDYGQEHYGHGWSANTIDTKVDVYHNDNFMITYTGNNQNSISISSISLASAGTYRIEVYSNSCRESNMYMPSAWGNVKTHTYVINVQDENSLDVVTNQVTNLNTISVTLNGSWTSTGSHAISNQRFKFWPGDSTAENLGQASYIEINDGVQVSGTTFTFNKTGLSPNTTYSYRALATSNDPEIGEDMGAVVTFTTPSIYTPTINIGDVTRTTGTIQIS